jgi:hypothetical protein
MGPDQIVREFAINFYDRLGRDVRDKIKNLRYWVRENVSRKVRVPLYANVTEYHLRRDNSVSDILTANCNLINITHYLCIRPKLAGWKTIIKYEPEWVEQENLAQIISKLAKLGVGESLDLRISGRIGWGMAVDNVVSFAGYTYEKWMWWNADWPIRIPIDVIGADYNRTNVWIEEEKNFTAVLEQLDIVGTFDPNSIRVVEYDQTTGEVLYEVPFEWEPGPAFDPNVNAVGVVSWIVNGTLYQDENRTYHIYFDILLEEKAPVTYEVNPILLVFSDTGMGGFAPNQSEIMVNLDAAGYADMYDVWSLSVNGDPTLALYQRYKVVMWFAGTKYDNSITLAQATNLRDYNLLGGNVWLSSNEFAYDAWTDGWLGGDVWNDLFRVVDSADDVDDRDMEVTVVHPVTQYVGGVGEIVDHSGPLKDGHGGLVEENFTTQILKWREPPATAYPMCGVVYNGSADTANPLSERIFYLSTFHDVVGNGVQTEADRVHLLQGTLEWFFDPPEVVQRAAEVGFGQPEIKFIFPNFRVMANQTFNLTINVTARGGNLQNLNLTLNISAQDVMNITPSETWLRGPYNLTYAESLLVGWQVKSNHTDLTQAVVNGIPQNGTSAQGSALFDIIPPDVAAVPGQINITDMTTLRTEVVGNVTPVVGVNFTIARPWGLPTEFSESVLTQVLNESDCVEAGVGAGENVAPRGNATCSEGVDCNLTIDEDEVTSLTLTSGIGAWLNVSLGIEYVIDRLELVWRATSEVNASIYYKRAGEWTSLFVNETAPTTKNITSFTGFPAIRTDAMLINQSTAGTLIIYEFRIFATEERVGLCYVYEFDYSNTTRSGLYGLNTTVQTQSAIIRNSVDFWVNYGFSTILIDAPATMINGTNRTYETVIRAVQGDVRNLTLNLTIENQTVVNITAGEMWEKTIDEILSGEVGSVSWTISANNIGETNTTSFVWSTSEMGSPNQSLFSIQVILEDPVPPNVSDLWFEYLGTDLNVTNPGRPQTNLYTPVWIYANVSDDVALEEVRANITCEQGGWSVNGTMEEIVPNATWGFQLGLANNPQNLELNQTGNWTVRIIAIDIGGNEKVSGIDPGSPSNRTFFVNDTYKLNRTPTWSVFNRGEGMTLRAWDVNDNLETGINWTVNLTGPQGVTQTLFQGVNDTYVYQTALNASVGVYSLEAGGSKNANVGNGSWQFNVSDRLFPEFNQTFKDEYSTEESIAPVKVKVENVRGSELTAAQVFLVCPDGTVDGPLTYLSAVQAYVSLTGCTAPSISGTSFSLTANASWQNNTGQVSVLLRTKAAALPPGLPPAPPPCVCEEWTDWACGAGGCEVGEMYQTRICTPAGCANESRCVIDPRCAPRPNFELSVSPPNITIRRGEMEKVTGTLANTGEARLIIELEVVSMEADCCQLTFIPQFELEPGTSRDFTIVIAVNLSREPREYEIVLRAMAGRLERTQIIRVRVVESPLVTWLKELMREQVDVWRQIREYGGAGVDVTDLLIWIDEVNMAFETAYGAIARGDVEALKETLAEAEDRLMAIKLRLAVLWLDKFLLENYYHIILGLVVGIFNVYIVTQLGVPAWRLGKEIIWLGAQMRELVRAREEAERDYFLRRIDETTFRTIMVEKQGEILRIRGAIADKRAILAGLIREKLTPAAFWNWMVAGPVWTVGRVRAGAIWTVKGVRNILVRLRRLMS